MIIKLDIFSDGQTHITLICWRVLYLSQLNVLFVVNWLQNAALDARMNGIAGEKNVFYVCWVHLLFIINTKIM